MNDKEFSLRSDIVHEIMDHPPGWIIRWGSTLVFLLLAGLILLSAWIQYPDVIEGKAMITTKEPPLRLTAYASGKLTELFKADNAPVNQSEKIALLENPTGESDISALRLYLQELDSFIMDHNNGPFPLPSNSQLKLGDLQSELNLLTSTINDFNTLALDPFHQQKKENLKKQIEHYRSMNLLNQKQVLIAKKGLDNATIKFNAQKQLYDQGAIAKMEFLKEDNIFMQAQQIVQDAERSLIQNQIVLADYEKQLSETIFNGEEKSRQLTQAINQHFINLNNLLSIWQRTFTVQSTGEGTVTYIKPLSVGQFVKQGEELFVIIPSKVNYTAFLSVPSANTG